MDQATRFKFRLYVAGDALNSIQALANLDILCHAYLADRHEIEVVDVLREPKRALAEKVFMTPTLFTVEPLPGRCIFGNLSNTPLVLQALGLAGYAS